LLHGTVLGWEFLRKKRKWALTRPTNKPDPSPVSAALVIPIRYKAYQQGHFITGIPIHCRNGKEQLLVKRKCRYSGKVAKIVALTHY